MGLAGTMSLPYVSSYRGTLPQNCIVTFFSLAQTIASLYVAHADKIFLRPALLYLT